MGGKTMCARAATSAMAAATTMPWKFSFSCERYRPGVSLCFWKVQHVSDIDSWPDKPPRLTCCCFAACDVRCAGKALQPYWLRKRPPTESGLYRPVESADKGELHLVAMMLSLEASPFRDVQVLFSIEDVRRLHRCRLQVLHLRLRFLQAILAI